MSSFGSMIYIRMGYYQAMRSFVLNEKRHLWQRMAAIEAELYRIGSITITYEQVTKDNGALKRTERRMAICVDAHSSLEKLLQSYVVLGGNPLDISMFFLPNLSSEANPDEPDVEAATIEAYPYGGVAAPISYEYHATADYGGFDIAEMKDHEAGESLTFGEFPGGYVNLISYVPRRVGSRANATPSDEHTVMTMTVDALRGWVNQDIKEKLHMIEEKIIKLCDLAEQLTIERDKILPQAWPFTAQTVGSSAAGLMTDYGIQSIIQDLDKEFFLWDPEDDVPFMGIGNTTRINAVVWAYWDDHTERLLDLMFG